MLDIWLSLYYYNNSGRDTSITGQDKKGEAMEGMEGMTNEQFNKVLKMIIQILRDSKDIDDAIKKIEALLN